MGSSEATSFWRFDSPVIYLFGGMFLILGLITAALIILVCSQRKQRLLMSVDEGGEDIERGDDDDQKVPTAAYNGGDCADVRPKLAVIMAGDEVPTYLATPFDAVTGDVVTHVS